MPSHRFSVDVQHLKGNLFTFILGTRVDVINVEVASAAIVIRQKCNFRVVRRRREPCTTEGRLLTAGFECRPFVPPSTHL